MVGQCVEIGIPMLILFVALSQYLKHIQLKKQLPIWERFALILSIAIIWAYAHILTASGAYKHRPEKTQISCRTDMANLISGASWIRVPYPLQWGAPSFSADHAFGMMAAVLVSLIESTGGYKAAARFASATPPPAHVLSRGIGWQGIGTLLSGLFGTLSGSSVSMENIGLLGSTRVGSRRVIQISAGFMIFFSILGKFGALFASIPFPIFAALYCVLFGLVGSVGLSFLQFTNMNSLRNLNGKKKKLFEESVHHRGGFVPRLVYSGVLHGLHQYSTWACSYQSRMGECLKLFRPDPSKETPERYYSFIKTVT